MDTFSFSHSMTNYDKYMHRYTNCIDNGNNSDRIKKCSFVLIYMAKPGRSGRLLGNSCSLGLRYVFWVYVSKCYFSFFPPLGLWSGNFFLIAPFLDHSLLAPFIQMYETLKATSNPYGFNSVTGHL